MAFFIYVFIVLIYAFIYVPLVQYPCMQIAGAPE